MATDKANSRNLACYVSSNPRALNIYIYITLSSLVQIGVVQKLKRNSERATEEAMRSFSLLLVFEDFISNEKPDSSTS